MMESLSNLLHMLLLTHLATAEYGPLSLILDTTTDLRGNHYFITYIRALEEEKDPDNGNTLLVGPVVYLYKIRQLEQSEDANALLEKIIAQLNADSEDVAQFLKIFKKKLVVFGSDCESIMQGKNKG